MYDHQEIENKWQKIWKDRLDKNDSTWLAKDITDQTQQNSNADANKYYMLDMFAYPSGSGLHAGHVEQRAAIDIMARYYRANGRNVLMPTGYDSFGLPTENYALKNNLHPEVATKQNTDTFDKQTEKLGISYDWTRKLLTSDPDYYKFTQWWFKFLYDRGLAYRKKQAVNWCPNDQTVLANEQVIDGKCERCDTEVIQKNLEQWFFKITDYADRLLTDLDKLDWPESTKAGQRNWIGKSSGSELDFILLNEEYFNKRNEEVTQRYTLGTQRYTLVFNTGNSKKIERLKKIISSLNLPINIIGKNELPDELYEVAKLQSNDSKEEPKKLEEAAIFKANQLSAKKLGLPIIGEDTGFSPKHEGFASEINKNTPKRNALKGKKESDLSKQEIAELMQAYYSDLVSKYSPTEGSIPATFVDIYALQSPKNNKIKLIRGQRDVRLTNKKHADLIPEFPLNSIVISDELNKNITNLSNYEETILNNIFVNNFIDEIAERITVYTTRLDTIFGASFVVISPEHKLLKSIQSRIKSEKNKDKIEEISEYINQAASKTELERTGTNLEKTGIDTGIEVINPITGAEIPLWIADYVLVNYGTGAVMGVPAHDERDQEFAEKYGLQITEVISDEDHPTLINSGEYNGLSPADARDKLTNYYSRIGLAEKKINYKLRDWSVSRQRYWGSPIPILYRELDEQEQELNTQYQQLPQKLISLHAFESSPNEAYHQDLKEDKFFQKNSIKVIIPELENSNDPYFDKWNLQIQSELNEDVEVVNTNTVLVGRSLSCWNALKVAENNKLRKLILVAPVSPLAVNNIFDQSVKDKVEEFVNNELDFNEISKNVGEIVIFLSTDDPYIPLEQTKDFFESKFPNETRLRIITLRDNEHFNIGISEFTELYSEIIRPVDLRIILESDLPIKLPTDAEIQPSGKAPLATSKDFQSRESDGLHREVDTLDTFVCSAWYFFRFIDTNNKSEFADKELLNTWGPVDFYIGGAEHTVLHLLYSRFFTKVAYDAGIIDFDEPFIKLRHQGLILGPDNRKMSKRWGNVINPNEVVEEYGADTLRIYEMFMGPLDQMKAWDDGGVKGVYRFLTRIEQFSDFSENDTNAVELKLLINKLIEKISSDIENLKFNTAVSEFMKFINYIEDNNTAVSLNIWKIFLQLLHPFAPFLSSELWQRYKFEAEFGQIERQAWPEKLEITEKIKVKKMVAVMVQGKKRAIIEVSEEISQSDLEAIVYEDQSVMKFIESKDKIAKIIYVPGKIINFVLKK